jgi:hypothetical protein
MEDRGPQAQCLQQAVEDVGLGLHDGWTLDQESRRAG